MYHLNSATSSLISLTILSTFSIHINKYILSVLGFTYPTVFQGWQTLVAVIMMRVVFLRNISPVSWNSFCTQLPLFVSYVGCIVAGSKSLSVLPVPVVVVASSIIPALKELYDSLYSNVKNYTSVCACVVCPVTVIGMFFVDPALSEMSFASGWLFTYISFLGAQCIFNAKDVSSPLSPAEKFFYCNLFSVVVLAPCSLYLEEAFEALHFRENRQLGFLVGCVLSGVLGTMVSILSINLSAQPFKALAISRAITCLLSPFMLPCLLNFFMCILILINLISGLFIETGMTDFREVFAEQNSKVIEQV